MRWFPSNKAAKKVIYCFTGIILLFFTTSLISLSGFNKVSLRFMSMYNDRLVPSMDLSHMIELQYKNRFLLEDAVSGLSGKTTEGLIREITVNNQVIDSVLNRYISGHKFENQERQDLKDYNRNVQQYRRVERQIMQLLHGGDRVMAARLFTSQSYSAFDKAIVPLARLEDDQVVFGREQYEEIERLSARIQVVLLIFMGIAVITAITLGLVISHEYINQR